MHSRRDAKPLRARRGGGPAGLPGALEAFSDGAERRIDVAEVNGRLFLNNVSLGVYGDAVQQPSYRDAKVRTLLETAQAVLGPSGRAPAVLLTDDAGREHRQPAVLLVSNNPYAVDQPVARGTRPALDTGQLGVLVLDAPADRPHPPARAWTAAHLEVAAQSTPVSPVMDAAYPGGVGVSASLAFSSAFRSGGSGLGLTR
jgi:hypothetical protein